MPEFLETRMKITFWGKSDARIGCSLKFCAYCTGNQSNRTRFCHVANTLSVAEDASTFVPFFVFQKQETSFAPQLCASRTTLLYTNYNLLSWDCLQRLDMGLPATLRHGIARSGGQVVRRSGGQAIGQWNIPKYYSTILNIP